MISIIKPSGNNIEDALLPLGSKIINIVRANESKNIFEGDQNMINEEELTFEDLDKLEKEIPEDVDEFDDDLDLDSIPDEETELDEIPDSDESDYTDESDALEDLDDADDPDLAESEEDFEGIDDEY